MRRLILGVCAEAFYKFAAIAVWWMKKRSES